MNRITTHPGEILREEFMIPLGLSANALARHLHVPPNRITSIISNTRPRSVTSETALRLSRYFGTTPQFWLNLQLNHDLSLTAAECGEKITAQVHPRAA